MNYMRVIVLRENTESAGEPVKVFEQAVEADKFSMRTVIAAINTPPRAPRVRKTKDATATA